MLFNVRPNLVWGLAAGFAINGASAQVTTDCNALEKDCPAKPAFGIDYLFDFRNGTPAADTWESSAGVITYDKDMGAVFTIDKQGVSPTLTTKFYFFGGRTEMLMKVAPGTGIISSMMWLSDVLDEVDWEFFGSNATFAETNYFGKGVPDYKNAIYYPVSGATIQDDWHNYTCVWTKEKLEWWLDGALIRTLKPEDAEGGNKYPQTPMKLSLGIWAGGDPTLPEGTRQWAGGDTDFSKAPFTMSVKSIRVTDYTENAKEYSYGDRSGSWDSIKVTTGNSTAKESIFAPPQKSISEKFQELPQGSKIGIYAGGGASAALIIGGLLFYCIRQRRRGAKEAEQAAAAAAQEKEEAARFARAGVDPDSFAASTGSERRVAEITEDGRVVEKPVNVFASPFDSRPNTSDTNNSSQWPMASPAAGAMRSPVPLLQDGAQTPRHEGPGPMSRPHTPGQSSVRSVPMASPSAMGHQYSPMSPQRSVTGPNAYMRSQSPSVGMQPGYGGPTRMQSPSQMPPRSASAAPSMQGYGNRGYGNSGYGNSSGPSGDNYWNGGYR